MTGGLTKQIMITAGCGCLAAGCATIASGPSKERVVSHSERRSVTPTGREPDHVRLQFRHIYGMPSTFDPELLAADEAMITPGAKVIGVFIGGEARAYPLFLLHKHQIVNHKVGGVYLSVSW